VAEVTVLWTRLFPERDADVAPPSQASAGAAGFDLCAANVEPMPVAPGQRLLVPTGISVAVPVGFEMQIRARSGLAIRHGIGLLNAPGTVDSDFRGEVGVIVVNHGHETFVIERGMRIAQAVIVELPRTQFQYVDHLDDTPRGAGGFGSTGI